MRIKFLIPFLLVGCGFASGLYQDILKAQDYLDKRKYKKAARVYEGILVKKPSKSVKIKIHYQLGEIYSIYLNDYSRSLGHFQEIVEDSNEPLWQVRSLEKISEIYFEELKAYNKAEDIYKKLMSFTPELKKFSEYKYKYALSIFHQGNYTKAIDKLRTITSDDRSKYNTVAYYYIGLSHFYRREWNLAINNWFEYLKREKRNDLIVRTKFLIANSYENLEKLKEAYNFYYSILGEYPNSDVIKSRLNSLYERRVSRKR